MNYPHKNKRKAKSTFKCTSKNLFLFQTAMKKYPSLSGKICPQPSYGCACEYFTFRLVFIFLARFHFEIGF